MNIVILLFFINVANILIGSGINFNHNYNLNYNLHKLSLRCIVFKEKQIGKIIKNFVNKLEIYHNKSIVSVAEGVTSFNELSEDKKTLIETVISLCY